MVPNHQPIDDILDFRISRNVPTEPQEFLEMYPLVICYIAIENCQL